MESVNGNSTELSELSCLSEEDVKLIVTNSGGVNKTQTIEKYVLRNASSKMLGFLGDYWKLNVVVSNNKGRESLDFFIKAISRTNVAKADVVRELKLFEKELVFYSVIKSCMEVPGIKPWSAKLVTGLTDAMVFQDLNALQYKLRNKFERFDMAHTLQALSTLARFHASAFIFEENRSKELRRPYRINDEYGQFLLEGSYIKTDTWLKQCMNGALEAVRTYSKYSKSEQAMILIESRWSNIWSAALQLSNVSSKHRSVICHRDLWNNNIMFHYNKVGDEYTPDDCMLVDYQATKCQPPTGDIMLLLYCNLDPKFREENMDVFLGYYHQQLRTLLSNYGIAIDDILPKDQFLQSAEEQRLWGLMVYACLMPQLWLDDDLTTNTFSDSTQFHEILLKNKGSFILKMMKANTDYREKVMEIFEELVERYCLH